MAGGYTPLRGRGLGLSQGFRAICWALVPPLQGGSYFVGLALRALALGYFLTRPTAFRPN
jgi:hypothetical protein